jgi:hypothetical protein
MERGQYEQQVLTLTSNSNLLELLTLTLLYQPVTDEVKIVPLVRVY